MRPTGRRCRNGWRPRGSGRSSTPARRRSTIRSAKRSCRRSLICWGSGIARRRRAPWRCAAAAAAIWGRAASTSSSVRRWTKSTARVRLRPSSPRSAKEAVIAFDRSPRRDDRTRVNERIRVREVRVIDEDGSQLGIMPPPQALAIARTKGLDLVEIAATAVPPVCRIMDFGRYEYQEQKRARSAKKHQKIIEVKEIKFRPKVDEHDYQFKKKHIERFLADGDKVKATIFFRGREMAHPEIGRRILERLIDDLAEVAVPENMPRQEGNKMHTILSQKAGGKKPAPKAPKAEVSEG